MILKRISNKIRLETRQFFPGLLRLLLFFALPFHLWAQNQTAVSNGAGMLAGGDYTGYFSAGQMGTYLFASGNLTATQGIILNEISSETEFTFVLSGNLTVVETEELKSGEMRLKSTTASLSGPPLSFANVFLILVETGEVFDQTTTDENGFFTFPRVPYKNFYLTVNTTEIPENPVLLTFQSNIFIQEVVVNGEVGTEGFTASVSITPVNGCDPEHPDYRTWYRDFDGDGFGGNTISVGQCTQPSGYVLNNLDCDDYDPSVYENCDIIPCSSLEVFEFSGPIDPVNIASEIVIQAVIEGEPIESATWDWGDGTTSVGVMENSLITGYHYYSEPGVYTVNLYLTNNCEETFTFSYKYVVLFDPSAGFVTGGGTIFSPPGASTAYPDASGIASFGFVSRYVRNNVKPTGNTVFEFDAGGLKFKSTEYDWLVVAGSSAKFKGKGKINGTGNYQFMISAEDGDLKRSKSQDKFRIKIWDEISGETVYDNEMNSGLDSEPATEILEGSIVIHVPKLKSGTIAITGDMEEPESDLLNIFPNPTRGMVNIIQHVTFDEPIDLKVFNNSGILILEKSFTGRDQLVFDMSNQIPGLYLIHVTIGHERFHNKLIVR